MGGASSTAVSASPSKQPSPIGKLHIASPESPAAATEPTPAIIVPASAKTRTSSQGGTPTIVQNQSPSLKSTPPKLVSSSPAKSQGQKKGVERLVKELQLIITSPQYTTCGYSVRTVDDNVLRWHVELRNFEGQLGADLLLYKAATSRDHVLLEVAFPADYPAQPPFMRICYPRFHQYTGHITIGGSICVHDLTRSGWNPSNELSVFLIMVRHLLQEGGALVNMDNLSEYGEQEAREAYNRVARQHGWKP